MSVPVEADFALIKIGDGATPTEIFSTLCGMRQVGINRTVSTSDRLVRDCAKPNKVASRKVRVAGRQIDLTGSGLTNKSDIAVFDAALGKAKNYKVELYIDDGTDTGALMGTFAAAFVMTAANLSLQEGGDASSEITLASHGDWTWTAAA
ncbi:hypothetical protein [Novosphingobium olei]|uniref:hypothetical protein n=1 Tax=Novosphingobium olei TaxID=2728851 RepID=UPI00308CE6D4|nr:phage tail tube protein [Novosphingobium olei]